jgi:signal transduction histidine kinase/CheY-like chemotaxis protein
VIDTEHKEPGAFDDGDRDRLQWLANVASSRIASALAERERLKAEDALSRVHGEVRAAKLESLGTLAGGIAHDFNNLLTVILGNVNLAQRFVAEAPGGPEARERRVLDAAHAACLRARDLTKQLLIFASGGAPIKRTGSIADLLRESVVFALHGSNVKAEFAVADGLHRVDMDAGQIHSVVNSLVLNAVQAMPSGGTIRVAAANAEDGGPSVAVVIEDHGCGIPEEHLEKIFDPYFTTKGSQSSGLGLSTAYRIVKEHGGTLGVRSRLGAGSTFQIRLPAAAAGPTERREKRLSPAAHQAGGHVLLMDDDESVRTSVAQMLVHLGHRVTVARHGEEALSLFSAAHESGRPFSAVILDLTIPGGMGGKEVIPKLRDIEPGVKAIVASGYSNDPVMAAHESYGFQAVIEKPFDLAELDQVLSRLIA